MQLMAVRKGAFQATLVLQTGGRTGLSFGTYLEPLSSPTARGEQIGSELLASTGGQALGFAHPFSANQATENPCCAPSWGCLAVSMAVGVSTLVVHSKSPGGFEEGQQTLRGGGVLGLSEAHLLVTCYLLPSPPLQGSRSGHSAPLTH